MMGPHVMVGITHDDHTAGLPYDMVERLRSASGIGGFNPQYEEEDGGAAAGAGAADAGVGGGDGGAGMLGLEDVGLVYPPEDADEMVSLQVWWAWPWACACKVIGQDGYTVEFERRCV